MRNLIKLGLLSQLAITSLGCAANTDATLSKDEARSQAGKADFWEIDWCERSGWYGDGACDEFCPKRDPDCGEEIDCRVVLIEPSCEGTDRLVDEATCQAAGAGCTTTNGPCGVVSRCMPRAQAGQEGGLCGGIAGIRCAAGLACNMSESGCGADLSGTCAPPPGSACITISDPVCGCDRVTYSNDCFRRVANVGLDHRGAC